MELDGVMGVASGTSDVSVLRRGRGESRLLYQARMALSTGLIFLGILITINCLLLGLRWYGQPFLGVFFYADGTIYGARPLVGGQWAGQGAGLHAEDQIVRVGTTAISGEGRGQQIMTVLAQQPFDTVLPVEVLRPANRFTAGMAGCTALPEGGGRCTFEVRLTQIPFSDLLGYLLMGSVVAVAALALALYTFLYYRQETAGRIVIAICALAAIIFAGRFEITTTYRYNDLLPIVLCIASGLSIQFGVHFPYSFALIRRRPEFGTPVFFIPFIFVAIYAGLYLINANTASLFVPVFFLTGGGFLAWSMIYKRRRSTSSVVREQATIVLIGILLALTPLPIWWVTNLIEVVTGIQGISFSSIFLLPPILAFLGAMVYALVLRRPVNTERLISEGVIVGALGIMLVIGYTLITGAAFLLTAGVLRPNNPILIAITLFVIAILFMPLRLRLERFVQQTFLKQRRNFDTQLESISRVLSATIREEEVVNLLRMEIKYALQPAYMFIYLRNPLSGEYESVSEGGERKSPTQVRFKTDGGLARLLNATTTVIDLERQAISPAELSGDSSRLGVLNTHLIARLRSGSRLTGFIALGPRQDEGDYTHEEVRFLESLADLSAAAFERAQVIIESQRNERELEVLVQVSQALNITMDFDTLLEFVYTQVDKIVPAPNFYIALRKPRTEEVEYVFYQEGEERLPEREGERWSMGRDLISEVIRSKQPFRTENYLREMQRRDSANRIENPNVRAWLGIPLNAAEGETLGCIAIASTDPAVSYTEEQTRILWSLADLAATSIYKTRLYAETTALAERMKSLNEISSGLATLFDDIDSLLQRITESAAKLLNSQASSLLTLDEATNELVFRHAFGGSGERLVNKRIPAGSGIAGTVVMTGRHMIVGNATNDPRWFGEVSKEGTGQFNTDSILAVPLSARNKVIGVLEVINKEDRTNFTDDDVSLLTTFASQAAIVVENANIYRQTDDALSERVKQLYNMQRIDQELNRSLDLQRVVELTVDNAIRESDADAGALALISDDGRRFVIVGSAGYPDDVLKTGDSFPIHFGVLGATYENGQLTLAQEEGGRPNPYPPVLPGGKVQLCVPLIAGETITGALLLESTIPDSFNLMTAEHIQALAEHANTAITNAQLFAQLGEANEKRIEFMRIVAHELNNPMTSIKGFAEFLLSGRFGTLNERQQDFLTTISRNTVRVQQLVSDLRDFAAQERGALAMKIEAVDFNEVVLESIRPQQRAFADKEQKLVLNIPEDLPKVRGDFNRLIQVMINLVSNANKYTPKGGTVTLTAAPTENIWDTDGAPMVVHCRVNDTGIGMSAEDLKKLFTPYWRSENPEARKQQGTGLGMSLTRGLVEAQGGKIWVESEISSGTTFNITIPLATEDEKVGA